MIRIDENNNVTNVQTYKAILVGVSTGEDISYSMEELKGLAEADNAEVLGIMTQTVERINAATFIGKGKLEELAEMVENMEADLVIFNDELTGMQLRNIEDAAGVRIIDRTMLILDIFADRATSMEAKLQVEMAQLQYRMPRLLGFGKSLSRLGGGIGTRGPGEKKLETDRRHIQRRIDEIKEDLKAVSAVRGTQRSKRESSGIPVVALVGYTNAGKSTIMNRMLRMSEKTEKSVFEKDMLFATLDTSQRLISTGDRRDFILADTVGFVSKLPHTLVEAFKSTLEEVRFADLIIHVADACYKDHDFHIQVTDRVLDEIGASGKPCMLVFNKHDLDPSFEPVAFGKDSLCISAKTGEGFDELMLKIKAAVYSDMQSVSLLIPYDRGDIVSAIREKSVPDSIEYTEGGTLMQVSLCEADRNRYAEYLV